MNKNIKWLLLYSINLSLFVWYTWYSSSSSLSAFITFLKSSKLVKYRKNGTLIYYKLADDHVEKIFKLGCEHINEI